MAPRNPYKVSAFGLSDIGLVRENNEDVWAELSDIHLYVLADGMGGHAAGEVAARESVRALCYLLKKKLAKKRNLSELKRIVEQAIVQVNRLVYKMGHSDAELKGMGTTLCCLLLHEEGVVYGHVGDSRIYRLREGALKQMTQDHSLLRQLVDLGEVSEHDAGDFMYKHIVTKAVGTEPIVHPCVAAEDFEIGDVYLLCSDGLSDYIKHGEIEAIINENPHPKTASRELVQRAKDSGGHDNVTVVILEVQKGP